MCRLSINIVYDPEILLLGFLLWSYIQHNSRSFYAHFVNLLYLMKTHLLFLSEKIAIPFILIISFFHFLFENFECTQRAKRKSIMIPHYHYPAAKIINMLPNLIHLYLPLSILCWLFLFNSFTEVYNS